MKTETKNEAWRGELASAVMRLGQLLEFRSVRIRFANMVENGRNPGDAADDLINDYEEKGIKVTA